MSLAFRLYAGGPLAGGRWWTPWISMTDWVSAVVFLIEHDELSGPVNVVGPDPVRNADFTKALARAVHRPAPWPIPKFALRIVLGEFANEAVASQRILPGVLNRAGYRFQHSTVDEALNSALA
jgi:NAD dependent epimerase/dehydratase family enzyme